jgi:hypothetical protein
MNFTLRVKNLSSISGAVYWYGIWYAPPNTWYSGYLGASESYLFSGVSPGPGYVYVDAYDASYNRLTDGASRGYISPSEGSTWEYDFATGSLYQVGAPPETFHLDIYIPSWAAGGYVEPGSGDYARYTTLTLTAHPYSGYKFTSWGGDCSGTSPTCSLYMDSDKYVEAYFEPVPVATATITRKELKYDNTQEAIPVSDVPQGKSGQVHIWGRNDSEEAKQLGIGWTVTDPNGNIADQHSEWEEWPYTGAGVEHEFIGSRFPISYQGTYTIWVGLYISPDATNPVDTYSGTLCTVKAELVPEFRMIEITSCSKI